MRVILFPVLMALSGCASQMLEGYIGKPVQEAMLDMGEPTSVFDLDDGRRAFQWKERVSQSLPITTPSYRTVTGPYGSYTEYQPTTTYMPHTHDCVYTLIASEVGKTWIVESFRKPTLSCE